MKILSCFGYRLLPVVLLLAIWSPLTVEGTCIEPSITLSSASGAAGQKVTVTGRSFYETCNDVGFNGPPPPMVPAKKIRIYFVQGDRKQELGVVDANANFEFSISVTVPANAAIGASSFLAERTRGDRLHPQSFMVVASQ